MERRGRMPSTYIHLAFRFTSVITFLAGSAAALRAYSTLAREAQLAINQRILDD